MTERPPIGGYLAMEHGCGKPFYPSFLRFNLGRTAFRWFLIKQQAEVIFLPDYLCESMTHALSGLPIEIRRYSILPDFLPDSETLPAGPLAARTWMLVVNYYGLLSEETLLSLKGRYENILVDFTQAFFQAPPSSIDSLCSIRKFFGVPDGAYLSTDANMPLPTKQDLSTGRLTHLTGRLEETPEKYYSEMLAVAHSYEQAVPLRMSALTENLLRCIDYGASRKRRCENFSVLKSLLDARNPLAILWENGRMPGSGPFCYPFLVSDGNRFRRQLAAERIFVPTYWTNVIASESASPLARTYAENILALPCDQRYGRAEMTRITEVLQEIL